MSLNDCLVTLHGDQVAAMVILGLATVIYVAHVVYLAVLGRARSAKEQKARHDP